MTSDCRTSAGRLCLKHRVLEDVFSQPVTKRTAELAVQWRSGTLEDLKRGKKRSDHPLLLPRVKVRHRGLAKNTAQLHTLFALSNLWMVRRTLLREARG